MHNQLTSWKGPQFWWQAGGDSHPSSLQEVTWTLSSLNFSFLIYEVKIILKNINNGHEGSAIVILL